jgi:hypothetical protein
LKRFGYSARNLSAHSVIVVLASYMATLSNQAPFVESMHTAGDRAAIQKWLARTLIKSGVWGSGLDTLLSRLRTVIQESSGSTFPVEAIEQTMSQIGKSLTFDDSELEDVLSARYGSSRAFAVLSLLYPGLDLSSEFHQDHIFPKSLFTDKALSKAGIPREQVEDFQERFDTLGNLQLLKGQLNIEKQAMLPDAWLQTAMQSEQERVSYMRENDLDGLPLDFANFPEFFDGRRARMLERLRTVLGL